MLSSTRLTLPKGRSDMPAMDALTAKSMWRDSLDDPFIATFTQRFLDSLQGSGHIKTGPVSNLDGATTLVEHWKKWDSLSEAFYVHPRMSELVTAASESMPEEPLLPHDLPTSHGFVLIPGGLSSIDVRGWITRTNAVQWASFGGSVKICFLTDKYDPADQKRLELEGLSKGAWERMPRYTLLHMAEIEFGKPLPVSLGPDTLIPPEYGVRVIHQENPDGTYNVAVVSDKGYSPEELQELFSFDTRTDPTLRWLVTMWRLMQQPLTSVEKEFPSRQMRRQLERKNAKDRHVSVITLRRKPERGHGDSEVQWSHRWLTRGHWRRQPYKEDGETVYRHIWIHAHLKGPEDKPLLVREHVYSLQR